MRAMALAVLGLLAGCENDFYISDGGEFSGVANPPSLATPTKEEVITQVTTPEVDVLWIVDDSCSMAEEQAKLRNNFPEFMYFFLDSGLDYHVGVISTDATPVRSGKLQRQAGYYYIDADTPNPVEVFAAMASLGTSGSPDEMGRRVAQKALTDPLVTGYNAGFYRENASLHMIVISDENDYSGGTPTRNEFVNWADTLKDDPDTLTWSSIVGPRGGCATAEAGTEYLSLTDTLGGISESICIEDWAPVLEQLGMQAAGLKREYFLSEVPVPGTLTVWVQEGRRKIQGIDLAIIEEGASAGDYCETTSCFTYEYNMYRNSVVMLDYVPSPLAKVHVKYELLEGWQPGSGEEDI